MEDESIKKKKNQKMCPIKIHKMMDIRRSISLSYLFSSDYFYNIFTTTGKSDTKYSRI